VRISLQRLAARLTGLLPFFPRARRLGLLAAAGAACAAQPAPVAPAAAPALPRSEAAVERGLPLVRNFAPRTYGAANQVWRSVIASDGRTYFGVRDNVIVFDGLSWSKIPVPNGAHLRALAIDAADTVWVGGVNELGRLVAAPDGRRVYQSLRDRVPAAVGDLRDIWRVFATAEGIWFQSNQAVLRWRDDRFEVWPMNERFVVLSSWLGDHLAVFRSDGWFKPLAGGGWAQLGDPAAKLGNFMPHFAVPHPAGGWLMALQGEKGVVAGFGRWDGHTLTLQPHPLDAYFRAKRPYDGLRLADGRYVVTTLQGGLVVLGPDLSFQTLLNEKLGLPSDAILSAIEDRHGAVWLGTEFGVSRVQLHPAYSWLTAANGLTRATAHPIVRWGDELLIGGTAYLQRVRPPAGAPFATELERFNDIDDKILCLTPVGDEVFVGSLGGVYRLHAGGHEKLRSNTNVFAVVPSRRHPDRVYNASLNGIGYLARAAGTWEWHPLPVEARGQTLVEADDGTLWVGTDAQGTWRIRFSDNNGAPPVAVRLGPESGLPPLTGRVRVHLRGHEPVFLTAFGVYRHDAATGRFLPDARFGARFADGSTAVDNFVDDRHGGTYLMYRRAGITIDPNEVKQLGYVRGGVFTPLALPDLERIDGFSSLFLEVAAAREVLWVMGQSAVLRIDIAAWRTLGDYPIGRTLLEAEAGPASARVALSRSGFQLRPTERTLRFRYGTPGLAGEPDVRHETRLRGYGDGAAEIAPAGERTFTNLPAGDYVFEVRGRSADGRWSDPAALAFTLLAPWWQTPWAAAGGLALLGAGIWGIVRRRTRLLERERTRLETVVAHRTAELAEKNLELQRLNLLEQDEKLSARLAEEKARLELLRYQLNPHFLFNSLNSIRALVFSQPDAAGEMVTRLAEFCRWTLTRGSGETTTVADEIEMLRTYLDIEKVRWQDALVTQVVLDDAVRHESLPQFLLLPLIENAIKYGGRTSPAALEVRVAVRLDGDTVVCEVANTGAWIEPSAEPTVTSTHIGLENLRQRLARHYGNESSLTIAHGDGWVRMTLRLRRGLPAGAPPRRTSRSPFPAV
jgi:hypothetical protein